MGMYKKAARTLRAHRLKHFQLFIIVMTIGRNYQY